MPENKIYDAIMVGGGVMGCATAYYLMKKDPNLKVAIVEKDPSYEFNSTVLSDANIRLQFNVKENIQISQYGISVLKTFAEDMAVDGSKPNIQFRQQGNLFMSDEAGKASSQKGITLQQSLGCATEWLEADQVKEKFSLFEVDQIAGAGWSPSDGTMDANAVLIGYKNKAIALGAEFVEGEVREILKDNGRVSGVRLASGDEMQANFVVNSSGAWTKGLTETLGIELPIVPIKRHVFVVDTNANPDVEYPLTVFPSGLYLIQEHANTFLVGKSLDSDPIGIDFAFDRNIFIEELWEELVGFAPVFDQLKISGGWAGLYAVNTFDGNAILGEWPDLKGFMLANGFSGHGFQQCHGVGRYLAELILGETPSIDLSIFSPQRILDNKPVFESEHKLV
ncbi:MAG: FAD-binding oxidoreductase [Chloroflexi bacterium]|nr:FAD-binding oxidoreductase [Chloroflexota bacterium]